MRDADYAASYGGLVRLSVETKVSYCGVMKGRLIEDITGRTVFSWLGKFSERRDFWRAAAGLIQSRWVELLKRNGHAESADRQRGKRRRKPLRPLGTPRLIEAAASM